MQNQNKTTDVISGGNLLLRVLSGSNGGAEVSLSSGSYRIGQGMDCDLVLRDPYVARNHAKIVVFNRDIHLVKGKAAVFVNGLKMVETSVKLQLYDVVSLGLTTFSIGPENQKWPRIRIPMPRNRESTARQVVVSDSENIIKNTQTLIVRPKTKVSSFAKVLGLFGVLLMGLGLFGSTGITPVEAVVENTHAERSVAKALQIMNLDQDIKVSRDELDRIEITGYVLNEAQEVELSQRLDNINADLITRIWNTESLSKAATTVVNAMGATRVQASADSPGEISFSGFVRNDGEWSSALAAVKRDIPIIRKIHDDDVQTLHRGEVVLKRELSKHGLLALVDISQGEVELKVSGILKETDAKAWSKVRSVYQGTHENLPPIIDLVRAEQEVEISIPVRSVSIAGDEAYMVTEAGIRYAEGGVLSDGFEIVSISPDHIEVKKDDRSYRYNLGVKDDND